MIAGIGVLGVLAYCLLSRGLGLVLFSFAGWNLLGYRLGMLYSRQQEPYDLTDLLELEGNEQVLDVGCGLGKATIAVAKLLHTG